MVTLSWLGDGALYPYYVALLLLFAQAAPRLMPRRNVLVFAVGVALTAVAVSVLKPLFGFPRPALALGGAAVVLVGPPAHHASFPSAHAAFVAVLAASLSARAARPVKWTLWLFAAAVCLSRVSVGAHFPVDLLGGVAVGIAAAGVAYVLVRALPARN